MADTTTAAKAFTKPEIGSHPDTWGNVLNDNFDLIDRSVGGLTAITISGDFTLSAAQAQNLVYEISGALTANATITFPPYFGSAFVRNLTTGGHTITCVMSTGGASIAIDPSTDRLLVGDGTGFFANVAAINKAGDTMPGTLVITAPGIGLTVTNNIQLGNYLYFAGSTGVVNGTGGPLIYGDPSNMVLKQGSGNGAWLFQNYAGANAASIDASGAAHFASLSTGAIAASGDITTPGVRYTGVEGGNRISFGWNGNIVAHVDATNQGNVALWNTAAQFASGMTIGGIALINNSSWLQTPYLRSGSQFYSDGTITSVGDTSVGGTLTIGGIQLYNNGGYLYSPSFMRTTGLQVDGSINASSDINASGGWVRAANSFVAGIAFVGDSTSSGFIEIARDVVQPFADGWGYVGTGGHAFVSVDAYIYYTASDPRLKTDIAPAPDGALDKVRAVPVINYRYKNLPDELPHTGFDASTVQEKIGAATVKASNDEAHTLSLSLGDMLALLWQAVQELSVKVDQYERPA